MFGIVIVLVAIGIYLAISLGLLVQTHLLKGLENVRGYVFIVPINYLRFFIKVLFEPSREVDKKSILRSFLSIDTTMLMMLYCISDVKNGAIANVRKNLHDLEEESKNIREVPISDSEDKERRLQYEYLMENFKTAYGNC